MPKTTEAELKFTFAREALPAVRRALWRERTRAAKRVQLTATYFDTSDSYLWRHGASLRVRDDGRRKIQTFKRERPSLVERDEFETQVDGESPDLRSLRNASAGSLVAKLQRRRLRPRFEVAIMREASAVELHGAEIEVALDTGEVRSNGALASLDELELELKAGRKSALFECARFLCMEAPITLSVISKAERGHLLVQGAWGRAQKNRAPTLEARMDCAEALQSISRGCLHDFAINRQALDGDDRTEAVHQGRISLRRLRALLRLFRPVARDSQYRRLNDELRWLSRQFGAARDRDVFQESVLEPAARAGEIPGARELAELASSTREQAHEALASALSSSRARLLLVELAAWIEWGAWRAADSKAWREPITTFARRALKKRLRAFLKRARNLATLEPAARHKVRIEAKKLRYMVAFFQAIPAVVDKPKSFKRLLKRLERVQACLGELQDDRTKARFFAEEVERLPTDSSPLVAYAAGRLSQTSCDADKNLARAVAACRKIRNLV